MSSPEMLRMMIGSHCAQLGCLSVREHTLKRLCDPKKNPAEAGLVNAAPRRVLRRCGLRKKLLEPRIVLGDSQPYRRNFTLAAPRVEGHRRGAQNSEPLIHEVGKLLKRGCRQTVPAGFRTP